MDVALKQRLVGATVLIALAVIVLPMMLGGRPDEDAQESRKIELPPQPAELDFQTRRFPVGEAAVPDAASATGAEPGAEMSDLSETVPDALADPGADSVAGEPSPGAVAHVELEPRDFEDALRATAEQASASEASASPASEPAATEPEASAATAPEAAPATPAAPASAGRYVVQVASFGSLDNANRLASTLQAQGYAVLSDTVQSDVGSLHRVRIGPFASEAEASQAVTRVRQRVEGVNPRVVDLQPDLAAQVTAPSDPLVRWVVQVGSFSSTGNADKLVERLRGEGLSAYKEAVSASGATIYRVRVGPYVERDEAIRVGGQVRERFSLDGVVMSAD